MEVPAAAVLVAALLVELATLHPSVRHKVTMAPLEMRLPAVVAVVVVPLLLAQQTPHRLMAETAVTVQRHLFLARL